MPYDLNGDWYEIDPVTGRKVIKPAPQPEIQVEQGVGNRPSVSNEYRDAISALGPRPEQPAFPVAAAQGLGRMLSLGGYRPPQENYDRASRAIERKYETISGLETGEVGRDVAQKAEYRAGDTARSLLQHAQTEEEKARAMAAKAEEDRKRAMESQNVGDVITGFKLSQDNPDAPDPMALVSQMRGGQMPSYRARVAGPTQPGGPELPEVDQRANLTGLLPPPKESADDYLPIGPGGLFNRRDKTTVAPAPKQGNVENEVQSLMDQFGVSKEDALDFYRKARGHDRVPPTEKPQFVDVPDKSGRPVPHQVVKDKDGNITLRRPNIDGQSDESKQRVTAEIAKQLLKEAGGDKDKARELARKRGYVW